MTELLRHGYTLADLHQMTAAALKADRSMAMDYRDRRDIAWSAIATALYEAETWPRRETLVRAGWQAIYTAVKHSRQQAGYRDRAWDAELGSAPRFALYWWDHCQVTPSHETAVVERTALPAVLAALTPLQRQVVATVAAFDGDRRQAAAALGIKDKALGHQLLTARRTCAALWLEHETPHRVPLRRLDARRHRGPVPECGTPAALARHRAYRQTGCQVCAPLERETTRAKRARRRATPVAGAGVLP